MKSKKSFNLEAQLNSIHHQLFLQLNKMLSKWNKLNNNNKIKQ